MSFSVREWWDRLLGRLPEEPPEPPTKLAHPPSQPPETPDE